MQAVATQLASLEAADDSFAGFMDAETATFASRIRRLMRSKVEELQSSMPGQDSGMQLCDLFEACADILLLEMLPVVKAALLCRAGSMVQCDAQYCH